MGGEVMPLVVATWPNKSVSVVAIEEGYSLHELFSELDTVGSPYDVVSMFEVPMQYGVVINTDTDDGILCVNEVSYFRIKEITHMGFQWPTYAARAEYLKGLQE
jgi:hypothetical protein